jgi:hypothetical protein
MILGESNVPKLGSSRSVQASDRDAMKGALVGLLDDDAFFAAFRAKLVSLGRT